MIKHLHHIDQSLTLWVNSLGTPFVDSLMTMVTGKEIWFPLYILVLYILIRRLGWKKALLVLVSVILTIVACDQTSNLVKAEVERLRPCFNTRMLHGGLNILEGRGNFFGFFSAHAANHFGFATCSLIGFRNDKEHSYKAYGIFVLLWAALVSISRVFVGKHYLGDIIVGTGVGCAYGILFGLAAAFLIRKLLKD